MTITIVSNDHRNSVAELKTNKVILELAANLALTPESTRGFRYASDGAPTTKLITFVNDILEHCGQGHGRYLGSAARAVLELIETPPCGPFPVGTAVINKDSDPVFKAVGEVRYVESPEIVRVAWVDLPGEALMRVHVSKLERQD